MQIEELLLDDTFHAYVNKTDVREVEKWVKIINKHPESKSAIDKATKIILKFNSFNTQLKVPFLKQKEYQRLINQISHQQLIDNTNQENRFRIFFRIAASVALVFAIITVYFIYAELNSFNKPVTFNEITAPRGSKSKIKLEDGTIVWLNAESTLKYPTKFNEENRKVCLSGEAYFKVKKEKERPFVVRTGDIKINVLGTSFNVKNYSEDEIIETIVESGIINIQRKTKKGGKPLKSITLQQNQKLVLYKDRNKKTKTQESIRNTTEEKPAEITVTEKKPRLVKNVETKDYTSWKDNRLVINEERLGSLVKRLERWYNVNIVIEDDLLKNKTLTGVFEKETVEQAITAICLTTELKFNIVKDTIKIYQ